MLPKKAVVVRDWGELPRFLEPGVIYVVKGMELKPRVRIRRELARDIALGVKEMVEARRS